MVVRFASASAPRARETARALGSTPDFIAPGHGFPSWGAQSLGGTVRGRIASSVIVAAAIIVGTAGCGLVAPQATTYHYFASDGVSGDIGEIGIRNAVIVTDKGKLGNLVVTIVNSGSEDAEITVQHESSNGKKTVTISAPANETTLFGPADGEQVLLRDLDAQAGSLLDVYFQYGDEQGEDLQVPVLDGGLPEYSDLLPIDVITGKLDEVVAQ